MKSLVFPLGTLLTIFFVFHPNAAGEEQFKTPAEIIHEYLNITKDELYQKCEERNKHCITVIGLETIEEIEQKNAERLIELVVNRTREGPPIEEELWKKVMDRHCQRDIVLQTMLDIGFDLIFQQCVPDLVNNNNELLDRTGITYYKAYCERLERIARQRVASVARMEH